MTLLELMWQVLATLAVAAVLAAAIRAITPQVGLVRALGVSLVVVVMTIPLTRWAGTLLGIFQDGQLAVSAGLAMVVAALVLACVVVVAIMLLVALEAVVPTGSVPGPVSLAREGVRACRRSLRYAHLAWIVSRSGLGAALREGPQSPAFGQALVRTLNQAGVTFVKLGQILSTRADLLPASLTEALEELQSSAAPVPASQVRELLTQEWGASPDEVLHHLEQEPFAAASVAQVHRAVLLDGRDVVVKVQRPGAREQVKVDCDILLRFAAVAEQRFAWARQMGLADLARGLVGSLLEELDYRKEARHTEALAQALSGSADIVVPQVVAQLSTGRVLVQSRLQGGSVAEGAERLGAEERGRLARELMTTTARSILVEGVFHADLHPGNIMLLDDGRLGLLDFGAIGVIDAETRQLLAALVSAVVADDNVTATAALLMAFPASGAVEVDRGRLQRELGRVMTFLAHTGQVDPATVSDLYGMLRDNGITVPGDVAGAVRTLTSLDGTLRALDPELGLMQAAREVVPALVADLASPRRNAQIAAHTALTAALVARRLPERVERVTDQLSRGELTVRTRPSASDRGWMRGVVDDVVTGALACVCLAMGLVFVLVPGGVRLTAVLTSHHLVAAGLVCVGVGLGMRFVVRVLGWRR